MLMTSNFSLALRIMDASLDPETVTLLLGVQPDMSHLPGKRTTKRGVEFTQPIGIWSISSKASANASFAEHVVSMSQRISCFRVPLSDARLTKYQMDFFVGLFVEQNTFAVDIPVELCKFGLPINIDGYVSISRKS